MSTKKTTRAEQARLNGARSTGPTTESGKERVRIANTKPGLHSVNATVLAFESAEAYEVLRNDSLAQWRPQNALEVQLVEEFVHCTWLIGRLRFCGKKETEMRIEQIRTSANKPVRVSEALVVAEGEASGASRFEQRIRGLSATRSRILADLRECRKMAVLAGSTQEWLKTKDIGPEFNPSATQLSPDPTQK